MKAKRIYQLIGIVIVIGIMVVIFKLSAQPGAVSHALSTQWQSCFIKLIEKAPILPSSLKTRVLQSPDFYLRKFGHLSIYALLGMITLLVLWQMPIRKRNCWLVAMLFCILYAITDEWHQYYVAGRGAQWTDVLIDTIGAGIGSGIVQLIKQIRYRK